MTDTQFKPMLASDWDEKKVKFPCIAQPKIDGVRGMHMIGSFTGRSLKAHKNLHATKVFSHPALAGLDGELAVASSMHPNLCTLTSSALSRIQGEPDLVWHLFDYVTDETEMRPYRTRYLALRDRVAALASDPSTASIAACLRVVPAHAVSSMDELLALDTAWLDEGYEGTILRSPSEPFKRGRSTTREGGLLRIKRFIDAEAEIVGIVEGNTNGNEAQTNELGDTFRSTHQENMTPNGQVGSMTGRMLADVFDPQVKDKLLLTKDQIVTISPGRMTAEERKHLFENQSEILGKISKFKFFPKGGKDKPRFPTHQSFRDSSDMGGE